MCQILLLASSSELDFRIFSLLPSKYWIQIKEIKTRDTTKGRVGRSCTNHRTGLSTKCTLIKTCSDILRTGTEAKFRPFVDSLHPPHLNISHLPVDFSAYEGSVHTLRCDAL